MSVAVMAPNHLLLCSQQVVSELDLTETVYTAKGPILLGIGHVPFDRIQDGYADTDYFFQVKDAPFGGTLPLMFNHEGALSQGAEFYQVLVDEEEQRQSWSDYWWNASERRFELRTTSPEEETFYPVHPPGELWYHHWLGYMLNTSGLSDEEHEIGVRLFGEAHPGSEIGSYGVTVRIDNRWPTAVIDQIIHHHRTRGPVVVDTCAIVEEEDDLFTFRITAHDQEGHLKSWHLSALWGDNQSIGIDSGSYAPTSSRQWHGIRDEEVPSEEPWCATVDGDPTSRRCAHTFYLTVWDRAINGWGHLHRSRYHKSITIMLPI
jgi:hypothetical protein